MPPRIHMLVYQEDGLVELLVSASAEASNNPPKLTTLKITALNFTLSRDTSPSLELVRLLGALMHDATSQFARFKLAIAPGVSSACFSTLLALQRAEEPEISLAFFEVAEDALFEGLLEGRYDAGMSLRGDDDPALKTQTLWREPMAVAVSSRFRIFDPRELTIAELLNYPIYRWQAEVCPLLDQKLSLPMPSGEHNIQQVTSFEMLVLRVAAGYGVGISAQSLIERASGWGINMRPLADGPFEVVTHLQRPLAQAASVSERFERRALRVVKSRTL